MKKLALVFAVLIGVLFGGYVGYLSMPTAQRAEAVLIMATPEQDQTMFLFGAERGGMYLDAECYSLTPVVACIAEYASPTGNIVYVGWVFKGGKSY